MQCFPQLATGATGQYPIRKRISFRTIRNICLDGREIKLADPAASTTEWSLRFSELMDDEMTALREFFVSMEGTLGRFTFLDPTDNLLAWSQKLDETVWEKDAMLQVSGDVADPFGSTCAWRLTNDTAVPRQLIQNLDAPANYYYSLSLWARSEHAGQATLIRGSERRPMGISPEWQRFNFSSGSGNNDDVVAFGIEVGQGTSLEVFGLQVESQIGASNYKVTASKGGLYSMTRFCENGLVLTSIGPSRHGCLVRLVSE